MAEVLQGGRQQSDPGEGRQFTAPEEKGREKASSMRKGPGAKRIQSRHSGAEDRAGSHQRRLFPDPLPRQPEQHLWSGAGPGGKSGAKGAMGAGGAAREEDTEGEGRWGEG